MCGGEGGGVVRFLAKYWDAVMSFVCMWGGG